MGFRKRQPEKSFIIIHLDTTKLNTQQVHKKKIIFASPSAYNFGGLATWLDYLLPSLQFQGWYPILALVNGNKHNAANYLDNHPYQHVHVVDNPTGSREGRVRAFERVIEGEDPDLVVSVNIPDALHALRRLRIRTRCNARAVMSIHGFVPNIFDDAASLKGILEGVICTNRLACDLATRYSDIPANRVHYAPCGVHLPEDPPPRQIGPSHRLRLAYVGRLDQQEKRVHDLLGILSRSVDLGGDVELVVVGTGPDEVALKRAVRSWGLEDRVSFTGLLDQDHIHARIYPATDALLITSPSETGPQVVWEAMAHQVVVVSSRFLGAGRESALIDGCNALLFNIGDCDHAAQAILRLRDPELRNQLIRNARRMVEQGYSIPRSVTAWHKAFSAIMASRALPPGQTVVSPGQPAGRLDRFLGVALAESTRRMLGIRFVHEDAGGEWPHAYGGEPGNHEHFWLLASELDKSNQRNYQ